MSSSKKYLNTKEVAQLLQVNEKGVYTLVSDKGLPATKVTGKWLFPRHFVEEWLDLSIVNLPAAANPALDSGRLFIAGSDDLLFQRAVSLYNSKDQNSVIFFANIGSMGGGCAPCVSAVAISASVTCCRMIRKSIIFVLPSRKCRRHRCSSISASVSRES